MPTSMPNFNFLALLVPEIKRVSQNLMWVTSPLPYPVRRNFYVCSKYLASSNSLPNFSIVSRCIMQLCEYVFPLYMPKNGVFGGFRVKMWKYCILTPKRHYPAWIRVCWCIACQNWFNSLSSRSVERFCIQSNKEKLIGNFGYMGRSHPWGDLDQMWHVGDMVDVITCAIFGDCQLRGVGVVRGVVRGAILPTTIDVRRCPYNTGQFAVVSWLAVATLVSLAVGLHIHQHTKFLFLARLVSEIWRGFQNNNWGLLISPYATWQTSFYIEP